MSKKEGRPFYSVIILVWFLFMVWVLASLSVEKDKREKEERENIALWCPNFEELITCESYLNEVYSWKILTWSIRSDEEYCYFKNNTGSLDIVKYPKLYVSLERKNQCYEKWKYLKGSK